jgi:hypothetical protein
VLLRLRRIAEAAWLTRITKPQPGLPEEQYLRALLVMDEDDLYLLDLENRQPLVVIPFFQIRPSPETEEDACYFYSWIEDDSHVRLVSYHFGREPEIGHASAPEVVEVVQSLIRREP